MVDPDRLRKAVGQVQLAGIAEDVFTRQLGRHAGGATSAGQSARAYANACAATTPPLWPNEIIRQRRANMA